MNKRHGTTTLFAALNAKTSEVITQFHPRHGSAQFPVERWFVELTMKQIRRGAYHSVRQLKAGIQDLIDAHHADPTPFVWTRSADEILASIARFAERTADARGAQATSRTTVTGH